MKSMNTLNSNKVLLQARMLDGGCSCLHNIWTPGVTFAMGGGGGGNNGDRLTKSKDLATNDVVDDINTKKWRQPQNEDILKTENDLENEDKLRN